MHNLGEAPTANNLCHNLFRHKRNGRLAVGGGTKNSSLVVYYTRIKINKEDKQNCDYNYIVKASKSRITYNVNM